MCYRVDRGQLSKIWLEDERTERDEAMEATGLMSAETPERLTDCVTVEQQSAWIERALRAGRVVSDSGLWLGGVARPERVIAQLRKAGCPISTTKKRVVDAANEVHMDLAWQFRN